MWKNHSGHVCYFIWAVFLKKKLEVFFLLYINFCKHFIITLSCRNTCESLGQLKYIVETFAY